MWSYTVRWAIDLDGVCYEWQRTVRYMLNHYRNANLPPIEEFWHAWEAPKNVLKQDDWAWLWKNGIELGLFRYGHMVKDTRVVLEALVAEGDEITIATARPEEAWPDTKDWIDLFMKDIPLKDVLYFKEDESKNTVRADVLVDDKLENCKEWAEGGWIWEANRDALLFDRPWNQLAYDWQNDLLRKRNVTRVYGWKGVLEWRMIRANKTN